MLLVGAAAFAQVSDPVIMTINGVPVTRSEFEYSYNKNNSEGVIDKKTVDEYVDLFINYKLKVAAALDAKLDTASSFKNEFAQYRDQQVRPSFINDEDIEKERQRFRKTNLSSENNGGVLLIDTKYADVKQLESKPFVVDADQMKLIKDNVHDYFGTNEKILRNEWDEAIWSAFYEGKVEVFALQMHLALTAMFFSDREQSLGNDITFSANRLQFAKIEDKVNTIKELFDRMMLSPDEGREILQMAPLPDGLGQKYYIRGEYLSEQEREAIKAAKAGKEKEE